MENKDKIIISVQLPAFLLEKLKEQAEKECTTTSYLIRKAILKFLDEEDKDNGNK